MAKARDPDPPGELAGLEAALKRGALARGYVLRGEERYFRERAIDAIKAKAEAAGYELCLHDDDGSPEFQLARLVDDLSGGGLFAARRLVIARGVGEHMKKVEREDSALTRAMLAFVRSPEDAGTLVVSEPSLRADHALSKAVLERGGLLLALRRLYENPPPWRPDPMASELVQWTARRAAELGLKLTGEQALYVAAATGNDLFALDDQLELLRAGGGRELRQIVQWTSGGSPWNVADHMLEGEGPRALAGVEALFRGGFLEKGGRRVIDESALAAMLVGALQRGVRSALELSRPGVDAAEGGGPMQQAAAARARKRSNTEWRGLLEQTADLERRSKSGAGIDANDFARLCLAWSRTSAARRR